MDTLLFLKTVLPSTGYYCAATRNAAGGWINTPFDSIAALSDKVLKTSSAGADVYYGMASYTDLEEYNPNNRRTYFRRTQANTHHVASVWLDVDINPDSATSYHSRAEFKEAFAAFLKETNLPFPLIVSSGGGFHVYWTFGEDISIDQWHPVAERMRVLCVVHGLKADVQCTADSARVLRPVGTYNYKYDEPLAVKVLNKSHEHVDFEAFADQVKRLAEPHGQYLKRARPQTPIIATDDPMLLAMMALPPELEEDNVRVAKPIVKQCRQIREAGTQSEPVWHRMICILKDCERGEEFIHAISERDPRYNYEATAEKIAVSQSYAITCKEFEGLRPEGCQGCDHYGVYTSPIQLGVRAMPVHVVEKPYEVDVPSTPVMASDEFDSPDMPKVYERTFDSSRWASKRYEVRGNGIFQISVDKSTGEEHADLISRMTVTPLAQVRSKDGTLDYIWDFSLNGSDRVPVTVSAKDIHRDMNVLDQFAAKGFLLARQNMARVFGDFTIAYLDHVREAGGLMNMDIYTHLGWGDNFEFVLGDKVIYPDGTVVELLNQNFLGYERYCTTAGDFASWRKGFDMMFNSRLMVAPFIMFLHTYSSPLMKFFPGTEATLSFVVGASGIGKTALASMYHTVWLEPHAFPKGAGDVRAKSGATMNALFKFAGVLHCLPFYIDEASLWDSRDAASYVFDITSGVEKRRLTQDTKLRESGTWTTNALATSNSSLIDKLQTVSHDPRAQMYRVVEFSIPDEDYGERFQNAIRLMSANYGHAGVQYARYLTKNAATGKLQMALAKNRKMLIERFKMTQPERYWLALFTCLYTGMELSRHAGLHDYPKEWVLEELGNILQQQRARMSDVMDMSSLWLGELMNSIVPNTLFVTELGMQMNGHAQFVEKRIPYQKILARVELPSGTTFISREAVNAWCQERGIRRQDFLDALSAGGSEWGYSGETRTVLTKGLSGITTTGSVRCYQVKQNPIDLEDLYQQGVEYDNNSSNQSVQ